MPIENGEYKEPTKTLLIPGAGRSGQTWFCYMMSHLLNVRFIEPYCLLRGVVHTGKSRVLDLTHGDLSGRESSGYSIVVKTHEFPDRHYSLTRKVILIVRDPRDMVTSSMHRYNTIYTTGSDLDREDQKLSLIDPPEQTGKSLKKWIWDIVHINRLLSTILTANKWAKFNAAWRSLPFTYVVRYEDLLDQPVQELKEVSRYLDIPVNEELIVETVEKFSFKNITGRKAGEEKSQKISYRKGTPGDHKNKLNWIERGIIKYFCKEEAKHYGYELL